MIRQPGEGYVFMRTKCFFFFYGEEEKEKWKAELGEGSKIGESSTDKRLDVKTDKRVDGK